MLSESQRYLNSPAYVIGYCETVTQEYIKTCVTSTSERSKGCRLHSLLY